jgi:hypothetical protein
LQTLEYALSEDTFDNEGIFWVAGWVAGYVVRKKNNK